MLPKKNRLDKKTLEEVFKSGRLLASSILNFKYLKKENTKTTRISFVAPKSVAKLAVKRNSMRRVGYNLLGKHIGALPFPVLGVFTYKKCEIEKRKIENEIKEIIYKIH